MENLRAVLFERGTHQDLYEPDWVECTTYESDIFSETVEVMLQRIRTWLNEAPTGIIWEQRFSTPVCFVGIQKSRYHRNYDSPPRENQPVKGFTIQEIWARKDHRRKGIASSVIQLLKEVASKKGKEFVEVQAVQSVAMYDAAAKNGFHVYPHSDSMVWFPEKAI